MTIVTRVVQGEPGIGVADRGVGVCTGELRKGGRRRWRGRWRGVGGGGGGGDRGGGGGEVVEEEEVRWRGRGRNMSR